VLVGNRQAEGLVWTYDPLTGYVVLQQQSSSPDPKRPSFRLVKVSQVESLHVLDPNPGELRGNVGPVSIAAARERDRAAIAKLARRGPSGVGRWAQEIFDALAKT
jgi:hypothetical protein